LRAFRRRRADPLERRVDHLDRGRRRNLRGSRGQRLARVVTRQAVQTARQPFGRITIANSDAAASPHTDAAFLEASRAVGEVLERRAFPFLTTKPGTSSGSGQ